MSKPISISFGKPKVKSSTASNAPSRAASVSTTRKSAFTADPDDEDGEDEKAPVHESVLGFTSDGGAILSRPLQQKGERVIENKGNADWRTRGRAPKAASPQQHSQTHGNGLEPGPVIEREVSKKAGLQFAGTSKPQQNGHAISAPSIQAEEKTSTEEAAAQTPQTADEAALSALLNGGVDKSSSTITIQQSESQEYGPPQSTGDETLDFRADVASRPDPATLDDYAAMPVEEFGMALLRGMGKKRRANGEVIEIKNPNEPDDKARKRENNRKVRDPNQGYLGIGAKPAAVAVDGAKGGVEDGLGAWGKADMRRSKNGKGEGLYTPVMLRDRRTGELITEKELEERKKEVAVAARRKEQDTYNSKRDEDLRRERRRNDNDDDEDHYRDRSSANEERREIQKRITDRRSRDKDRDRDRDRDSRRDERDRRRDDNDRYRERSRRRSRSRHRSRSRSRSRLRSRSRNRYRRDLEARTRGR